MKVSSCLYGGFIHSNLTCGEENEPRYPAECNGSAELKSWDVTESDSHGHPTIFLKSEIRRLFASSASDF